METAISQTEEFKKQLKEASKERLAELFQIHNHKKLTGDLAEQFKMLKAEYKTRNINYDL